MAEAVFAQARREMTGLLVPLERRVLEWLVRRVPAWVTPDHLTGLGLAALALAGLSYWAARDHPSALLLVIVCLAVNWFGDSLDGTLARARNCQRPRYGFYVDHIADVLGTLFLVGGMGLSGYMSPVVALALLVAYYLVSIDVFLATYCRGTFRMAYWGFGATELRVVIAVGNVAALVHPYNSVFGARYLLFDVGGTIAAAGLLLTFLASIAGNTRALYAAEPLPRHRV